ncbi:DUF445 domain-containing protein [Shewanella sp. NIFS-20-20]|uniref:DUF445 domain-containing protein n=1 Tax=Shewanella sp. NIFS-20-20 TaxID=2853806 RepID=UPI001C471081|nr:DUF445 domain-containing protein [Shewanella sp. NIFS-20-20]MBV7316592.1 DUF445 domain-containing protein [Shewanella sp. NIFS-20-20]
MSKSTITNLLCVLLTLIGYFSQQALILSVGLFALSGAITNALAVHMLFEKVPGLYGSGVIPARFEEFKRAISELMMEQFFTDENIDKFLSKGATSSSMLNLSGVITKVDLNPAFDALVTTVEQSSFGGMLAMFGGNEALVPLRQPFIEKMQASLVDIATSEDFQQLLINELEQPEKLTGLKAQIKEIIEQRLNELTPQMVKVMVQHMIKAHLGWLVIWGGVFGGLLGLVAGLIQM